MADKQENNSELPNIRTFKHDLAESLGRQDVSIATMAIQEQKKRETERESTDKEIRTSKLLVILIAVLIGLGAIFLAYVIFLRPTPTPNLPVATLTLPPSLVQAEKQSTFDLTGKIPANAYKELATRISGGTLGPNTIEEIILTITDKGAAGPRVTESSEFWARLGIKSPERMQRFLDKPYMLGIYTFSKPEAFLIFKPTSFGPVFADLLDWEKDMPAALLPLLASKNVGRAESFTWENKIIRNIDTRIAKDGQGNVVMVYAFLPSKEELIISASEDSFNEVLLRLLSPHPVNQ